MKRILSFLLLAPILCLSPMAFALYLYPVRAQFPPPITGPVIPADVFVFNAQGVQVNHYTAKDESLTIAGYMNFQVLSTIASGSTSIVTGVVNGHGRTASGPGAISGTWRQELDRANQPTGAILVTFGCGTEQFEWLVYFSPSGGSFIDRSLYRRLSGRFER